MSITDKFWGSQVATTHAGKRSFGVIAGELSFAPLFDVACVARLKGWSSVTVGLNSDGREAIVAYEVA